MSIKEALSPELFSETRENSFVCIRDEIGCSVFLITPFYISIENALDTNREKARSLLPRYIDIEKYLIVRYNTRFVNLQKVFRTQLMHRDVDSFCSEPVHPKHAGYIGIANTLLTELSKE